MELGSVCDVTQKLDLSALDQLEGQVRCGRHLHRLDQLEGPVRCGRHLHRDGVALADGATLEHDGHCSCQTSECA